MTQAALTWLLDPSITFLNHGSFGSCPAEVHAVATEFRMRMEREPVHFVLRELEGLLDETRHVVAEFVGADPADIAFVPNATTGVNAVLASLTLDAGDELLVTDHAYNACRNALNHHAERLRARIVVAKVPFPLKGEEQIIAAVLDAVTERTRLALLDHVASQTALIFPVARLVRELEARGVDTLIDGAHAPGMVPLDLRSIGASYYSANFHKWCCAPKGAGMLHVRRDRRNGVRPHVISHGANATRTDRSKFFLEFDWTGTSDASPTLSIPSALKYLATSTQGGFPELQRRNRELVLSARRLLADALALTLPCPDELVGSMASLALPDAPQSQAPNPMFDPLYDALFTNHRIEVPVFPWPSAGSRMLRVSAHLYNDLGQYEALAEALVAELARETRV